MSVTHPSSTGPTVVLVEEDAGMELLRDHPTLTPVRYDLAASMEPDARQLQARAIVVGITPVEPAAELMRRLPDLRLVQTLSAGYEQWVDHVPPHVKIANVRGVHGMPVAEWIVGSLIAHFRELTELADWQRRATWRPRQLSDSLIGKRVAIVGAGDIALRTRGMLTPFDCAVTLVGRSPRAGVITLEDFLRGPIGDAEVIVLAVPVTPETTGLVDDDFLSRTAPGALLVNAGRGALVDQSALARAATAGRIHAILDVVDPEPLPSEHPLWATPHVTITPHVGGAIPQTWPKAWRRAVQNLEAFASGLPPIDLAAQDRVPLTGHR